MKRSTSGSSRLHVLDLVANLANGGTILLGANGCYHSYQGAIGTGGARVVFDPGLQLDLGYLEEEVLVQILLAARAGVEIGDDGGIGVYGSRISG